MCLGPGPGCAPSGMTGVPGPVHNLHWPHPRLPPSALLHLLPGPEGSPHLVVWRRWVMGGKGACKPRWVLDGLGAQRLCETPDVATSLSAEQPSPTAGHVDQVERALLPEGPGARTPGGLSVTTLTGLQPQLWERSPSRTVTRASKPRPGWGRVWSRGTTPGSGSAPGQLL